MTSPVVSVPRFYYGWFVLAASAVSELLLQGATSYGAGLFVLPLQAEFHLSRAAANSPLLILLLGVVLMGPLAGRSLDRFSIRAVMIAGALVFAGGLVLIATSSSLAVMVLALLIPCAIGLSILGPINTATVAARWFHRRRGMALGLAAVATSGGALMVPLLNHAVQQHGWRQALIYEAAVVAGLIIVLTVLVMRDSPAALGLDSHSENSGRAAPVGTAVSWSEVLSRRDFWIPSLLLVNLTSTSQALLISVVPYGVKLGLTAAAAAAFISAFGVCAAVTKVLAGFLADRMNPRQLILASNIFMFIGQALICFAPSHDSLLAASCLAGVALGCAMPTASGLIARSFGAQAFATAIGLTWGLSAWCTIVAVLFIGRIYDVTHGYGMAFGCFLVVTACIFLMGLLLPPRVRASA
jgi:MFS family permease